MIEEEKWIRETERMKRVLFLANHFVALYAYRKELILRLLEADYDVYLSLPESDENRYFADKG